MRRVPILRCFPSDDDVLAVLAEHALEGIDLALSDAEIARYLARRLRAAYPNVVVRAQDPLAAVRGERVWYVFASSNQVG